MAGEGSDLAQHRTLVELLDTKAVLGYLVQNKAITQSDMLEVEKEPTAAQMNVRLLHLLSSGGHHSTQLLINALRTTGQLSLASLLDGTQRIRAMSGSGYLSRKRRRGQLCLKVEVSALKFDQSCVVSALHEVGVSGDGVTSPARDQRVTAREWVSLQDISQRISILTESQTSRVSSSQVIFESAEEETKKSTTSCFCGCFSALLLKKKKKKKKTQKYLSASCNNGSAACPGDTNHYISTTTTHITSSSPTMQEKQTLSSSKLKSSHSRPVSMTCSSAAELSRLSRLLAPESGTGLRQPTAAQRRAIEKLQQLLQMFTEKGRDVYRVLEDPGCGCRDGLIKYLEQKRGVLVLDTERPMLVTDTDVTDALYINVICTKPAQVCEIRADISSHQFSRDLESILVTEEVLSSAGVLGIKLQVSVHPQADTLDLAETELINGC